MVTQTLNMICPQTPNFTSFRSARSFEEKYLIDLGALHMFLQYVLNVIPRK